jgi:hypothetical protein
MEIKQAGIQHNFEERCTTLQASIDNSRRYQQEAMDAALAAQSLAIREHISATLGALLPPAPVPHHGCPPPATQSQPVVSQPVPPSAPLPHHPPLSLAPPSGPPPTQYAPPVRVPTAPQYGASHAGLYPAPPVPGIGIPPPQLPPQNPPVFGLSPLEEIRSFNPSGSLNTDNLAFTGACVGPLMSASDTREHYRRKMLSGQHSTSVEEVKSQLYWPHQLLDVCALAGSKRPEYDDMSVSQFVAGFTAFILVYLPAQLRNTPLENQIKHLNKLMAYSMVSDWSSVLGFNAKVFHACENHQLNFTDWPNLSRWHERHLQTMRFSPQKSKNPNTNGNLNADVSKDPNFVPQSFMRSQHLCMKFQSGRCDEPGNHIFGKVTLVHACALCAFKDRGSVVEHGTYNCPKRSKNKKKPNF